MVENWDTDDEGNIMMLSLVGWEMTTVAGTAIAARLKLESPPGSRQPLSFVQIVIGPTIANEMAEALSKVAAALLAQRPQGPAS